MSSHFVIIGFLLVAASGSMQIATAQRSSIVSGTITDSASGEAVIGARVRIDCPECYGRHPTDSTGRYRINRLPTGTFRIEFHCPSVTGLGAEILQRMVTIPAAGETVIDVRVPKDRCWEPSYSERTGIFRGYWTPGFESSAFVPCEDRTMGIGYPLLPGKRVIATKAWADLAPSVQLRRNVWPKNVPVDAWGNPTYFVVWRGTLKGPGTYGHMGVSDFSMIVDSMIAVRAKAPGNCRTR